MPFPRPLLGAGWRSPCAALIAATCALGVTPAAFADGGPSIAAAPTVTVGQQLFGNTTTSPFQGDAERSWWLLNLAAGDRATIDWQGSPPAPDSTRVGLDVFPAGTTDFNFATANQIATSDPDASTGYRAELNVTAASSGSYPLDFWAGRYANRATAAGGPYSFTVTVLHGMTLGLPAFASLPLSGTIAVGVHAPDGTPLDGPAITATLQATIHGDASSPWTAVGAASPIVGTATVSYALPANFEGKRLDVRAVASGSGYLDASSAAQTVDGPPPPPTPTSRSITIKRAHGRYRGRLSSPARACMKGVTVSLYRKSTGTKVYGTGISRADGSWTIRHRKIKGKVYAAVSPATVGGLACQTAASRFLRH